MIHERRMAYKTRLRLEIALDGVRRAYKAPADCLARFEDNLYYIDKIITCTVDKRYFCF